MSVTYMGRYHGRRGEENSNSHLTEAIVREIRERSKIEIYADIVKDLNNRGIKISHSHVRAIAQRRTWKHVV